MNLSNLNIENVTVYEYDLIEANIKDYISWLVTQGKLKVNEEITLNKMINSRDIENFNLAICLVQERV